MSGAVGRWARKSAKRAAVWTARAGIRYRHQLAPVYVAAGGAAPAAYAGGTWGLAALGTASFAGGVVWYRSTAYRTRRELVRLRARIAKTRLGEDGARIMSLTTLAAGVRLRIRLGPRQTFGSVSRDDLAHDLDVAAGSLSLERDGKTGRMVTVRILRVDRFAGPEIPHPAVGVLDASRMPKPALPWRPGHGSILTPCPIGVTREDELAELNLYRHGDAKSGALFGKIGSGKSNVLNVITAHVARSPDVVMWVSDAPKSGATFRPWESVIDWAAYTVEQTRAQMLALRAVIAARAAAVARSDSDKWKPSPKRPAILYVIEEAAALFGDEPDLAELATSIVLTGRQSGVVLIVSSQGATWESVPTRLRDQLEWVVALKMTPNALKTAWPGAWGVVDMSLFDVAGLLYVNDGGGLRAAEGIVPARSYALYDPPIRRALATLYGHSRPVLDEASAAAGGDAYAARHGEVAVTEPAAAPSRRAAGGLAERLGAARALLESAGEAVEVRARPVQLPLGELEAVFAGVPAGGGPAPDDEVTLGLLEALAGADEHGLSKSDLAATVSTSPETALRRLTRLRAQGRVRTTGKGPRTRWHLVEALVTA